MHLASRSLIGALVLAAACSDEPVTTGPADTRAGPLAAATVSHDVTVNAPFDLLVFVPF
jgi:hypothetical protein